VIDVGGTLKNIRKKRNLTQDELSKQMNISRSYLSDVENNRKSPTIDTLCAFLEKLNISFVEFASLSTENSVGEKIRKIRKELGLSMDEFAKRIDSKAKSGTVSNWETGKNLPNNKRLRKIADMAGMTVHDLVGKE